MYMWMGAKEMLLVENVLVQSYRCLSCFAQTELIKSLVSHVKFWICLHMAF